MGRKMVRDLKMKNMKGENEEEQEPNCETRKTSIPQSLHLSLSGTTDPKASQRRTFCVTGIRLCLTPNVTGPIPSLPHLQMRKWKLRESNSLA